MTAAFIATPQQLAEVPDGTIISWLRINGDPTSEAVAFVRVEHPDCDVLGLCTDPRCPGPTVWISPGGWDPMSIEQADVRFPATVIRWGEVNASEAPVQVQTLETGGSYVRVAALDAAVQLFKGDNAIGWVLPRNGEGPFLDPLFDVAKAFETHLYRDDLADAMNAVVDSGLVGEQAYEAWLDRDRAAAGEPTDVVTGEIAADDEVRYRRDGL
ncbi:hypothetical protein I5G59_gp56 [Mycobacterium phage LilMcDreamy]|uniref:Uncharacterized protein n=1 Tax=Mycobacterium phage LilMcDreamy TaxID=2652422 RepID=A0A5P8D6M9_9CAUD|nr:hypothetical protein I5G59_gp56 [Mycobacterium phage LilMcDreamy]QFP94676.1 hypothetical protein SEA_LILMCDREAMY_56 [Mycobacterium phage LilMcDreamy]